MEEKNETTKAEKIDKFYSEFLAHLRLKVQEELTLTDEKMHSVMMNRGKNHEYYVSVLVDEKRKLKNAESATDRLFKQLVKHYMSPSAKISAKTITEAKEFVLRDERYINAEKELGWRTQIVSYLDHINKLLTKQYFTVSNILDFYKLDPSNMASSMKEDIHDRN